MHSHHSKLLKNLITIMNLFHLTVIHAFFIRSSTFIPIMTIKSHPYHSHMLSILKYKCQNEMQRHFCSQNNFCFFLLRKEQKTVSELWVDAFSILYTIHLSFVESSFSVCCSCNKREVLQCHFSMENDKVFPWWGMFFGWWGIGCCFDWMGVFVWDAITVWLGLPTFDLNLFNQQ